MFLSALFQQLLCFFLHVETSGAFRKPLSQKEELRCFQQMRAGDALAREKLILHNMRLVAHIIKKYYTNQTEQEDLLSIGTVGLMKAVSTFDYEKGARFATYASRCIENEILMYLRRYSKIRSEVSFDEPLNIDWDGNELLLSDILGTDNDIIYKSLEGELERKLLYASVGKLTQREKIIMQTRFGLFGQEEKTQKEVADMLGISQSYISRLEKRIIRKLQKDILKAE